MSYNDLSYLLDASTASKKEEIEGFETDLASKSPEELKELGLTPAQIREIKKGVTEGFEANLDSMDPEELRRIGLTPAQIREIQKEGFGFDLERVLRLVLLVFIIYLLIKCLN